MMAEKKRKPFTLTYVDDNSYLGHIVRINVEKNEGPCNRRRVDRISQKDEFLIDTVSSENKPELEENVNIGKPSALFDDNECSGCDVYSFKTTRTKKQPSAVQSLEMKEAQVTHSKSQKNVKSTVTKQIKKKKKKEKEEEKKTPYALRMKIKQRLAKVSVDEISESSSSSEDESEAEDDASSDIVTVEKKSKSSWKTDFSREKLDRAEDYFIGQEKNMTSDHTLARLKNPVLDQAHLFQLLREIPITHEKEVNFLYEKHKKLFVKWKLLFSEGFNLLLHGLGSKRDLLLEFRETMLSEEDCIVINGFFPNVMLKEIFTSIIEGVLELHCKSQNLQEQMNFIKNLKINEGEEAIYLIIHNIDGIVLRSETVQNLLSQLAHLHWIHIIASIDHINASLMWDQQKLSRFQWIWFDVTTFEPYKEEIAFENSLLVQPSKELMLSSLMHVFRSLNPKARGIFELICRHQLDNKENGNYMGISYQDCYHKCREAFLVNSDLTLRAQLTEFKDHKLIKSKKGHDGVEYLVIPLDSKSLTEFIEHHLRE